MRNHDFRRLTYVDGDVTVGKTSDFFEGLVRVFLVEDVKVAVVRHRDRYYAFPGAVPKKAILSTSHECGRAT